MKELWGMTQILLLICTSYYKEAFETGNAAVIIAAFIISTVPFFLFGKSPKRK